MKKNPLFSCLTYIPPVKLSKKQSKLRRIEAMKELNREKNIRRELHKTDREVHRKYKEETREKIKNLNSIVQNGR